jgi:hypothetical protein
MAKKGQSGVGVIRNTRLAIKEAMDSAKRRNYAGGVNPFGRRGDYGDIQEAMRILRDAEREVVSSSSLSDSQRIKLSSTITSKAEGLFRDYVKPGEYSHGKPFLQDGPKVYEARGGSGRVPVMEYINEIERTYFDLRKSSKSRLEGNVTSVLSIVTLLAGIFFLSSNITGNAIADLSINTTSFLGAGLLIVGLVAGFFWLKNRK